MSGDGRLAAAFDRARFGDGALLDLHPLRPTAAQAADRVRRWLLERQVMGVTEALVITGRGKHSPDGVSPVQEAVRGALGRLKREGVIAAMADHSAGSFVVTLAPIGQRLDATARRRDPVPPKAPKLRQLEGLPDDLVMALEELAARRLESLGIVTPTAGQVIDEMGHVFSRLVGAHAPSEAVLRDAIRRATDELDG